MPSFVLCPNCRRYIHMGARCECGGNQGADRRKSSRQRGYTRRYERSRAYVLSQQPTCEVCERSTPRRVRVAEQTHHLIPLHLGGPSGPVWNLQPICRDCHHLISCDEYDAAARRIVLALGKTEHAAEELRSQAVAIATERAQMKGGDI